MGTRSRAAKLLENRHIAGRVRRRRRNFAAPLDKLATALRPPPTQAFLDLGCGVLRGGIHFIRYLDASRYYGIDANPDMIAGAARELDLAGLMSRGAHLRATESFDIDFGQQFDYGLAVSVFTHIPLSSIHRALANFSQRFAQGGKFHATYFPGPDGPERFVPITHPALENHPQMTTFADANPYHYAFDDFEHLCTRLPLHVDNVGDRRHPHGQHMLRFTPTS